VQPLLQRKSITYSECLSVVLGIQQAMRMRYIVACPALYYAPALSHKRHDFRKK
jgi:methyl coenzyme M reductase gamma subunit